MKSVTSGEKRKWTEKAEKAAQKAGKAQAGRQRSDAVTVASTTDQGPRDREAILPTGPLNPHIEVVYDCIN